MLPTVFLSLSGTDDLFVSRVYELLPDGLSYFYKRNFQNGESLLSAMEERVGLSSIFCLFASKSSIESAWVGFEIDEARLHKITNESFRILVFIIDKSCNQSDLPKWMRHYWVPRAGHSSHDVARYVRNALLQVFILEAGIGRPVGRGALVDAMIRQTRLQYVEKNIMPNFILIAGIAGIGRRTVQREYAPGALPTFKDLLFGPAFQLAQYADIADLYRSLRQELEEHFTVSGFAADLKIFQDSDEQQQVDEVLKGLEHFASLGQAVTFIAGNALFEDSGQFKSWVRLLISGLDSRPHIKLFFISFRQARESEARHFRNFIQFRVTELADDETESLMIEASMGDGDKPVRPEPDVIRAIGGHPGIAKAAARIAAQQGQFKNHTTWADLHLLQEEILDSSLGFDRLSAAEKDALSVLSWVPQLEYEILKDILVGNGNVDESKIGDLLAGLLISSLISRSAGNYYIAAPIRGLFRRKFGYGSPELRTRFADVLASAWARAEASDTMKIELYDAYVFMAAIEGGTLPKEFNRLLLPSTLRDIVAEAYDQGFREEEGWNNVKKWGLTAKTLKMDEVTREDIVAFLVRAQIRTRDIGAKETLKFIESRGYASRFFLKGFYIRHTGDGNIFDAIDLLKKAQGHRKHSRSAAGELALIYLQLADWKGLEELINELGPAGYTNPVVLDLNAGLLIAKQDYPAASAAIKRLALLPGEDGRADSRRASLLMKRDRNFEEAEKILTKVLARKTRGALAVRRLRAIAAASSEKHTLAQEDADFFRSRKDTNAALRIEGEVLLHKGDLLGAIDRQKALPQTPTHSFFLARVLEAKAKDQSFGLAERQEAAQEAAEIRARFGLQFDFGEMD